MLGILPLFTALLLAPQQVTERVSLNNAGLEGSGASEAPAVTADGQIIAFQSAASDLVAGDTNAKRDILLRDLTAGQTELISVTSAGLQVDGDSMTPAISADGNLVAFASIGSGFAANDINATWDVVLRDRAAGTTRILSQAGGFVGNAYSWTPAISADGRFVAFESGASDLVHDLNEQPDVFVGVLLSLYALGDPDPDP